MCSSDLIGVSLAMMTAMAAAPMTRRVPRSGSFITRNPTSPTVAITGTTKCPKRLRSLAFRSSTKASTKTTDTLAISDGWIWIGPTALRVFLAATEDRSRLGRRLVTFGYLATGVLLAAAMILTEGLVAAALVPPDARILFGPAHRFGSPAMGTAATIRAITRDPTSEAEAIAAFLRSRIALSQPQRAVETLRLELFRFGPASDQVGLFDPKQGAPRAHGSIETAEGELLPAFKHAAHLLRLRLGGGRDTEVRRLDWDGSLPLGLRMETVDGVFSFHDTVEFLSYFAV